MSNEVPEFKNEDVKEKLEGTFSSYRPTYPIQHTLTLSQRKSSRSTWYIRLETFHSFAQTNLITQSEDMQQEAIEVGTCLAHQRHLSGTNTNTVAAQDAMEKYTVEKVCLSAPSDTWRSMFGIDSHHHRRSLTTSSARCVRILAFVDNPY
jgi:hypothetical protein